MTQNPIHALNPASLRLRSLRRGALDHDAARPAPTIGMVSVLGCPKALVDSERNPEPSLAPERL